MRLAYRHRFAPEAALIVGAFFCLGLGQVAHPLRCTGPKASRALAAPQQQWMCHATQEVNPRHPQPPAPDAIGWRLPVVPVAQGDVLPRVAVYVPVWPIENWPAHRRIPHLSERLRSPARGRSTRPLVPRHGGFS